MSEKDYSLLRPFDLEAAKRGNPVLQQGGSVFEVRWVARAANDKTNIVEGPGMHGGLLSRVDYAPDKYLRMAPLAWVEGRPVYPGDALYRKDNGWEVRASEFGPPSPTGKWMDEGGGFEVTWTKPAHKVKRHGWVNIYPGGCVSNAYEKECDADFYANPGRVACIRIEWEEEECT